MGEIVFYDLETTGRTPLPVYYTDLEWQALHESRRPDVYFEVKRKGGRGYYAPGAAIIQIAAAAVDDETFELIDDFEAKLAFRPELASAEALEMNSYDAAEWAEKAVSPRVALASFNHFCDRHATVKMIAKKTGRPWYTARLAGHNISTFDDPIIRRAMQDPEWQDFCLPQDPPRMEPPPSIFFKGGFDSLDTLQLARWHFVELDEAPESLRLETLAEYFGIEHNAHDAFGDVIVCIEVCKHLLAGLEPWPF